MRHPVHPVTALSFVLFSFLVALTAILPAQIGLLTAVGITGVFIGEWKKFWKRILFYVVPLDCLLLFVNILLGVPSAEAFRYAMRFTLLVAPLLLAVLSTPTGRISLALRTANVPPRIHYLFLLSLEMVTMLRNQLERVRISQQLRGLQLGANPIRRWISLFPMLMPVLLFAVSQGLEKSMAVEFKGLERTGPKTYLRKLPLAGRDKAHLTLLSLLSLAIVIAWGFRR
ncbi:MAG TPA: energy-coupling factor transporter transmembrane component T [Bacteroidota bacterium]|nr:energy-coupling factor transporter transmembrane component T [Bacteroidota bacterium]